MIGCDDFHQLFELLVEFRILSSRFLDFILKFCDGAAHAGRRSRIVAAKKDCIVVSTIIARPRKARGRHGQFMWDPEHDAFARLTRTVEDPFVGLRGVFFLFIHGLIAKEYPKRVKVVFHFGLVIDPSQKERKGTIDAAVILGT